MSEIKRLIKAYDEQKDRHAELALAIVVRVYGSSYRRPGARMLVNSEGRITGTISGGCLEGDALKRARYCIQHDTSMIVTYDSTDRDEDLSFGAQLGCQGKIEIFIVPVHSLLAQNQLEILRTVEHGGSKAVLATVIASGNEAVVKPGNNLALDATGFHHGFLSTEAGLISLVIKDMGLVLISGRSIIREYEYKGNKFSLFLEIIFPAPVLTIFGAGADAQPVSRSASAIGFNVHIIDGRLAQAKIERFPEAVSVQLVSVESLPGLDFISGYVLLMSHNYPYDLAALNFLTFCSGIRYIGILGPAQKTRFLLDDLESTVLVSESFRSLIHGPAGLDLGAENPDEIALSIMAEIVCLEKERSGKPLKLLDHPIHSRDQEHDTIFN